MEGTPTTSLMVHRSFRLWSNKDAVCDHKGEGGWVPVGVPGTSAVALHQSQPDSPGL